jgi:peptidoglycan biosynthesis protein MviN/MurJ (putative lipid II flippase)
VFGLLPSIGGLLTALGSLYSLYLLYVGLPKLMKSDPQRTLPYFALIFLIAIVIWIVMMAVTSSLRSYGGPLSVI